MNEVVGIEIKDGCVNARDLWKALGINQRFNEWIKFTLRDYSFKEDEDFYVFYSKSPIGRPLKEYAIPLETAKELAMISKAPNSRKIRKYFIECEKKLRQIDSRRLAGIEARKTMTDAIKDSGQNDSMHGFAYSTYTKLVYKKAGIEYVKDKNFRDKLNPEQLKAITELENVVKSFVELGYEYSQIKNMLPEIILKKERIENDSCTTNLVVQNNVNV